jgi:O-acetyl-ADP-ribose deacetylase (regulator of RNase III)
MISLTRGNMFDVEVEALVNTVNTVGVMGRGVALQFKKAYPANFKEYLAACKAGALQPGGVLTHEVPYGTHPRFIFNVATKEHWRGSSRLEYVERGLRELIAEVTRLQIRTLAMPPLGCGLGGLRWSDVYPRIEQAFAELPDVRVLLFEPAGEKPIVSREIATKRPNMTSGRAVLIALMQRYLASGYEYALTLLEIQKLAYFMQEAGQPLKLQFKKHHYGPYADNLQKVINHIDGHFIDGNADGSNKPDRVIQLRPDATEEAADALKEDRAAEDRLERVARLIDGFDTPFGMELLATVHWVATHDSDPAGSSRAAFERITKWNSRKARLMKPGHVDAAWSHLANEGWFQTAAP